MNITFWGVRGSIPVPGPSTVKYGGNTSCVSVIGENGEIIILDGGSGLRNFGNHLLKEKIPHRNINMFFSHVHWDHIQGIPFFKPLFNDHNTISMYGEKKVRTSLESTLKGQQQYPNFPISLEEIGINGAQMTFNDLYPGQVIAVSPNISVSCTKLSHPDGVLCYKIRESVNDTVKTLVYATDTEHRSIIDPRLHSIAMNADVLIYDAQYTPDEYAGKGGIPKFDWGHSTYEVAVDTAVSTHVKQLILFHHDPEHDDSMVDSILEKATQLLNFRYGSGRLSIQAAAEGNSITI